MDKITSPVPELWGGIECTVNRLKSGYLDQLQLGGIYENAWYLDALTDLPLKKIRFPVLWERHEPVAGVEIDWNWTEARLNELKANNITPIAGLLHHGSGPSFTSLLDDNFPELFATYAAKVAEKFPWIEYYTPINEPLTTARFSGLYGLWYPHKTNDVSFVRMLLNELKATVLAMRAIRSVNPSAKFIQTEDLGKTYSTALLRYQANFENQRRWLTYDLLLGKFTADHPLWDYLVRLGIDQQQLQFFINNPCPPDIIGVNHYVTSERFLDEQIEGYPATLSGGNGVHTYVDTEAVRVLHDEPAGLEHLLGELWERYHIPIAITEAHLNCTREEQLRWFNHVYTTACKLKTEAVEIVAVTSWALFGSFGWNKLLTCENCAYETGAFDISAGYPRPTALVKLLKNISSGAAETQQPLMQQQGWWQRTARYNNKNVHADVTPATTKQPVVIIGKTGTLGKAFAKISAARNIHHLLLGREEADICNEQKLAAMIRHYRPWAIINAAGFVKVDEAEADTGSCYTQNSLGVLHLGRVCRRHGVKLMTFSSDLVFDGSSSEPYVETDLTNTLNVYGHSKQLAELLLSSENPQALVIRTAAFFSPWDEHNFAHHLLTSLIQGRRFVAADDQIVSPTYVPHLVQAALDLLIDDAAGIWHLANKSAVSWYEFAKKIAVNAGLEDALLEPGYNMPATAQRPRYTALGSTKFTLMPSLDEALQHYISSVQTLPHYAITQQTL